MSLPHTSAQIRESFLTFFEGKDHQRLPSDSLVPTNDPTLLFTGAGMNQFKDEFLGHGRPGLTRATTSQKCLRVPDLENVGRTPRHHTFFEMLGNFSFGDYFKAEAIPWEWEFFTEVLGLDGERMVASVYQEDEEAYGLWRDGIAMPEDRIFRFGEKENFWPSAAPSKGPNGPCGPCSELYFDLQPDAGPPPDHAGIEALPDRFLEIGNFVFTQFDRQDGGDLKALPQRNIDVGLGLERIAAVVQKVPNNFETDAFAPLMAAIQELSGKSYGDDPALDTRMRRIADHARAVFFCLADGVTPGRDGRAYVVRKILRRAVRDAISLDVKALCLPALLGPLQETMAEAYPQLTEQETTLQNICAAEEERFREVYAQGISRLDAAVETLKAESNPTFPGTTAFELHDTWGFPSDITEVIVQEQGLKFDRAGFDAAMSEQKERARAGSDLAGDVFGESIAGKLQTGGVPGTCFEGWERDQCSTHAIALIQEGQLVDSLVVGQAATVLLSESPFYGEGGGQVGDAGQLLSPTGDLVFAIERTTCDGDHLLHYGKAHAPLEVGDALLACVDCESRRSTERHHTATHLLHAALRAILGDHVHQAGSFVGPEHLRFDYTHPQGLTETEILAVEDLVLQHILADQTLDLRVCGLEEAKAAGVTALFGEKYGDEVRVVEIPGFSAELCGGTHVTATGAIGDFRLLSDRALSAGVRRIEAVAGLCALAERRREATALRSLAGHLKVPAERLLDRIESLQEQLREARRRTQASAPSLPDILDSLRGQSGPLAWLHLEGLDADSLGRLADQIQASDSVPSVLLLAGGGAEEIPFVLLADPESGHSAHDLARTFGKCVQGGGGGRPDFARGKGGNPAGLKDGITALQEVVSTPA